MALKYFFEYRDTVNSLFRCEISNDDFVGTAVEINGSCVIDYPEVTSPIEAIKGLGLKIDLEASETLTLEDLYTEEERSYKVTLKADDNVLFNGFLNPDGVFQDFVNDKWVISMDCVDGLGLLENLSYVTDTGLQFTIKQSELEIISNCLRRTGLVQNINTSINIFYTGLSTSLNPLANVYLDPGRFYKDEEKNNVMQCDEVLKSVLDKYCACITQQNGEWYVYRPKELFISSTLTFFRYDSAGVPLSPTTKAKNTAITIGSQVNAIYPHHANANQRIEIRGSLAAFRINYKYGDGVGLILNSKLLHNGTVVTDWFIQDSSRLTLQADGAGISQRAIQGNALTNVLKYALNFDITQGTVFDINCQISNSGVSDTGPIWYARIRVTLFKSDAVFYLDGNGDWSTDEKTIEIASFMDEYIYTLRTKFAPITGGIELQILDAFYNSEFFVTKDVFINEISLITKEGLIKGEFHTTNRISNPSTNVKEVKEIFNGDNVLAIFEGAIYKADEISPTSTWFRQGITEAKPILRIMGEETLRISANPARVFSGDVFGYVPYLSLFTINGVTGKFIATAYSYNTAKNIITLKLLQIFGAELDDDIDYEFTLDYGTVVKPTIRG
jgi:hypothetical protein